MFHKLGRTHVRQIAGLMVKDVQQRVQDLNKGYSLRVRLCVGGWTWVSRQGFRQPDVLSDLQGCRHRRIGRSLTLKFM